MAHRNVLVGWCGKAVELTSSQASVLAEAGLCEASFHMWGGALADATVLVFRKEHQLVSGHTPGTQEADRFCWETLEHIWPNLRTITLEPAELHS